MFPIRSVQGAVIGFGGRVLDRGEPKYLNSPETPVFVKAPGTLRALRSAHRDPAACPCAGRRRVHGRGRAGPGRFRQRCRNARHRLHRGGMCTSWCGSRKPSSSASTAMRPGGEPRGGHSRRACRTPPTRAASASSSLPRRTRPGHLRPRARRQGVRSADRRGRAPVASDHRSCRRRGRFRNGRRCRARFLAQARVLWSALPDGMLKRQLLGRDRLARRPAGRRTRDAVEKRRRGPAAPSGRTVRSFGSPTQAGQAGHAATARSPGLDAVARERLVGHAERRGPRAVCAPCPAGTATLSGSSIDSSPSTVQNLGPCCASASPTNPGHHPHWP